MSNLNVKHWTDTEITDSPYLWIKAASEILNESIDKQILGSIYDEYPIYKGGTKLLRDFAQLSNDYIENKVRSRFGWKTRREIRNV